MNLYLIGNFLSYATLLMIAGTGNCFVLKNGQMNLGGEGQIYLGGFLAAITINFLEQYFNSFILVHFITLIICIFSGVLVTSFCAELKCKRGATELLTTFLLSAAIIPLIDQGIAGYFRTTQENLLATEKINQIFRLKQLLPPSSFNISFFIALLICYISYIILNKTLFGERVSIYGISQEFALFSGFSKRKSTYIPLIIGGAFHSIAGYFATVGIYYTCHSGFYSGIGWNALSVALISKANPLVVIPTSLLLSLIFSIADYITLIKNFSFDISTLIQGTILFCIGLFSFIIKKRGE